MGRRRWVVMVRPAAAVIDQEQVAGGRCSEPRGGRPAGDGPPACYSLGRFTRCTSRPTQLESLQLNNWCGIPRNLWQVKTRTR